MDGELARLSEESVEVLSIGNQVDLEAGAALRPASAGWVDLDSSAVVTGVDEGIKDLLIVGEHALVDQDDGEVLGIGGNSVPADGVLSLVVEAGRVGGRGDREGEGGGCERENGGDGTHDELVDYTKVDGESWS